MANPEKLALFGGSKAVTQETKERWPVISEDDVNAVVQLMLARQLSIADGGGVISEFEKKFANFNGAKHALVQNNGTSTLHAAYFAVGIGPGDQVIVPTYTWPSTANAVLSCNATPVFCDIDPRTLCIDPADVARKITRATKAIGVVHIWGHPANMDTILEIAQRHDLRVIEDASHAHGATYKGRKAGTIGDVGCFSLQASKMIIGGEAGIAVTNNPEYFDRMLALSHYGGRIEKDQVTGKYADYAYTGLGPKYRVHPLAAAIANVQLEHLDEWINQRRSNLDYLTAGLRDLPGIEPPYTAPDCTRGAYYGYRIVCHPERVGAPIIKFIKALQAEGVDAQPERYQLLHRQALYQGASHYEQVTGYKWPYAPICQIEYKDSDLPIATRIHANLIALPTFTQPCHQLLDQYVTAFRKVIQNVKQLALVD
jgi:dTDP-4-amino-4,6-dideoxygalactose transaminase